MSQCCSNPCTEFLKRFFCKKRRDYLLLLLGSPQVVFQCVCFLECSPHWAALRPVHTTMAGVSGLRSPHCLVLPCMEFSQLPAKNMPGESAAERHRWVMLHMWLHGPAPQLPVVCGLSSRPPGTPGAFLHCISSCGKGGWEALGFGIEHRVCALLCCVHGQNLPVCGGFNQPSSSSPLDPSSLPCLEAGPLAMAQGIPGYGEQVCLSAPAEQCDSGWAASQAGSGERFFFCLWLTGSVLSCGAPAAQLGWLVFVEVTVSFSVFKRALASLLLFSDGDGLAGAEVAYREDSSFGISGTFLTMLQPSALPAGWAGTTCGERSRAGCS